MDNSRHIKFVDKVSAMTTFYGIYKKIDYIKESNSYKITFGIGHKMNPRQSILINEIEIDYIRSIDILIEFIENEMVKFYRNYARTFES